MQKTLTIYKLSPSPNIIKIEPASRDRLWMETHDRVAYRCLPLVIANQHGWSLKLYNKVSAIWNGGISIDSVKVIDGQNIASSHFGNGILTFRTEHLFKLSDGYNLYITGEPNNDKADIVPLSGVYEADWAPYTFTMNWKFTAANKVVTFDVNESFCFIFPVERELIESFKLEVKTLLDTDEEYRKYHRMWGRKRDEFIHNKESKKDDWQKHYFRGLYPDDSKCPIANHKTKLILDDGKE